MLYNEKAVDIKQVWKYDTGQEMKLCQQLHSAIKYLTGKWHFARCTAWRARRSWKISYFIEWQDRTLWQRLMNKDKSKEKNVFTIRINEADVDKARDLVTGLESVKIRKMEPNEK